MAFIKATRQNQPKNELKPISLLPGNRWRAVYSDTREADIFAWALLPDGQVVGLVWDTSAIPALVSAEAKWDGMDFQRYRQP